MNNILNEPFNSKTLYYDKDKKQKKYNGHFKNGKYCGFGKLYDSYSNDSKLEYEGFFENNEFNGKGILYKNGKKKYEGHLKSGKYNCIGIEYLSNGNKRRKMKYENGFPLKECYGALYDDKNREIYIGILKNGIPDKAKLVTIYDDNEYLLYIGDFNSFKYHGEGTLYFERNNKVFFKGEFKQGEYVNGILYDLYGIPIYKGSIMNNIPKEGQNIKLYRLNTNIKYEGNYKYNGYGKLYTEKNEILFNIMDMENYIMI